jgi:hypothetical protein
MATFTLRQYCQALSRALDDFAVYTVAASGASSVTSVDIADLTTSASANRFDGAWVYARESGVQRRALKAGLTPATGALALNYTWTLVTAGSQIDVTRLFPIKAQIPHEDVSYTDLVNRALAKLLIPDRVTVAITTADSISLAAYRWIDRPERILRVMEPPPSGTRPVDAMWRGPQLVLSGGAPTLELRAPFDVASGSVTIEALRPADTLLNGVETAPGTGLSLDTQTAIAPLEDVVLVGLMEAYLALSNRDPGRPGQWTQKYADARERAENAMFYDGAMFRRKTAAEQQPVVAA